LNLPDEKIRFFPTQTQKGDKMFLFNVYFHFFVVVNVAVDVVLSQEQPVVATIISTFCSEMIYFRGEKEMLLEK